MPEINIGQRLKEFRTRTKIKMPTIAYHTCIAKETLYKWEKGTRPSDINDYIKLKAYLDEMENRFEEDLLKQETKKPATMQLPLVSGRSPVLQTDGQAAAGTIVLYDGEPVLIVDRINAPFLGPADGVIEITGDSMSPTFSNGYRIVITRLNEFKILDWGLCYYIIDNNRMGLVRRVYQGQAENWLLLVADNPNQAMFPPIQRQQSDIEAIFKVVAGIQKC